MEPDKITPYAKVVPVVNAGKIDKPLTYSVPERFRASIKTGSVVAIGLRKKISIGIVTGFEKPEDIDPTLPYKIREIYSVYESESLLNKDHVRIAEWMSRHYVCPLTDAFSPFTPEVRALQPITALIVNNIAELKDEFSKLGLLFGKFDDLTFESLENKRFRISQAELRDFLNQGGISQEDSDELISEWEASGVLIKDLMLRTKIRHIGKGSHLSIGQQFSHSVLDKIRSSKQRAVLELLNDIGGYLSRDDIMREIPGSANVLSVLIKKGYLEEIVDTSLVPVQTSAKRDFELSSEQNLAIQKITNSINSNKDATYLLFGVTGSGKTEIYIEVCKHALEKGKRATVLVPEIALTHQAVRRFMQAFPGRIALFHSELTERERLHEWRLVRTGKRDIVIGARSALFVPIEDRGVIIIDEESETAYKQHQKPRYNAREVARAMSKVEKSVVVLGSATPSIESYYYASKGQYELIELSSRVVGGNLPEVRITRPGTPLKEVRQKTQGNAIESEESSGSLLSRKLKEELTTTIQSKRQAILFLNQRGFSRSLICQKCGWIGLCKHCDVSLTYHKRGNYQLCHYCGYREQAADVCKKCGSNSLDYLGYGTERIENEVRSLFPSARIMRMDRDTVASRGKRKRIVDAMRNHEVDILVGTQMIAKGLDFPSVRLVGVVSADSSLFIPDFRAAERTFQLLTQVAGRAGRSDALEREGGGIAIVQSYNPDNRVLISASRQDFKSFFESEIVIRQKFGYPPACRLARILFSGKDREQVLETAGRFRTKLESIKKSNDQVTIGPSPAPLERLEGKYRVHIIAKAMNSRNLSGWIEDTVSGFKISKSVKIEIDIDPLSMM